MFDRFHFHVGNTVSNFCMIFHPGWLVQMDSPLKKCALNLFRNSVTNAWACASAAVTKWQNCEDYYWFSSICKSTIMQLAEIYHGLDPSIKEFDYNFKDALHWWFGDLGNDNFGGAAVACLHLTVTNSGRISWLRNASKRGSIAKLANYLVWLYFITFCGSTEHLCCVIFLQYK